MVAVMMGAEREAEAREEMSRRGREDHWAFTSRLTSGHTHMHTGTDTHAGDGSRCEKSLMLSPFSLPSYAVQVSATIRERLCQTPLHACHVLPLLCSCVRAPSSFAHRLCLFFLLFFSAELG